MLKPLPAESLLATLNAAQRQAVQTVDAPCLVLAGAGSGKTRVITQKIAYLVQCCQMKARHIMAVTFTNKAAREMKQRLGRTLPGTHTKGLTVSTFHRLGLDIIRKESKHLGYKPGFSIFDAEDSKALIHELIERHLGEVNLEAGTVQHRISAWKNDLCLPDAARSQAETVEEAQMAEIYQHYQRTLKAYNAVDFDDLVFIPVQLFTTNPEALARWQQRVRYLLVDEYQDTNSCQYHLIRYLVACHGHFTVVGDDDQSIYAWRGAKPENLSQLQQDFTHLKVIKLEQNYRSTCRILNVANQLIAHNPHEFVKTLWSDIAQGEKVRIIKCRNEESEAERVALEILTHRLRHANSYRDYAILYRSNHQSKLIEMKLRANQIPYHINGGTSFFSRAEIKDVMAYLRILINPDDDNAFLRIVNTPRREIGSVTLEKLGSYALDRHISLYQACQEIGLEYHLEARFVEKLRHFTQWLDDTARQCQQGDAMAVIRAMLDATGYENWLLQTLENSTAAQKRMANIHLLMDQLQREYEKEDESPNIKDAIAKLVLRDLLERQSEEDDTDRVQLLTLHAAKGLEYPHVVIMGMEEDLLPHKNSETDQQIEEERRLAYVGITRAQKTLCITLTTVRKQYGEWIDVIPSRFIDELPDADIEWINFHTDSHSEQQHKMQTGNNSLSAMRALLDN